MPEATELPEPATTEKQKNVFDKIEKVSTLLEKESELSEAEIGEAKKLLTEITEDTKRMDGEVRSFFEDSVFDHLQNLLPQHPFFHELNKDSSEFIDFVDLLIDGEESFEKIIESIKAAEKSIYINIFIWRDDHIGNQVAKEVLSAADRGVRVTIVKDQLGAVFEHAEENKQSFFHKELLPEDVLLQKARFVDATYMQHGEASDTTQKVNPLTQKLLEHPNITVEHNTVRNDHSKYYIFDDERLITGGMNIGDEYHKEWHDYMVEAESPLLVQKFRERLSGNDDFDEGSSIEFSLNLPSSLVEQKEIEPMVIELLNNAEEEVIIEMAYFGDEDITDAIVEVANRNVDVTIIIPERANIQDSLNRSVAREIIQKTGNKVKVYLFPRMLHAKLIHVDGRFTFLGSANLNEEATQRLAETNILINDKNAPFTQEVRQQLSDDMSQSSKVLEAKDIRWTPWIDDALAMAERNAGRMSHN